MSASPFRLLYCGDVQTDARRLRDAGVEVVVLAGSAPAAELAAVAVQEDVDLLAVEDAELGAAALAAGELEPHVVVFWVTSDSRPSRAAETRD